MKYILGVISLAALLLGVVQANECIEEKLNACEEKFDAQAEIDDEDCSVFENGANCARQATDQCEATEADIFGVDVLASFMEGIQEACEEDDDDDTTEKRFLQKRFVAKRGYKRAYRRALKRAFKRGY